MTETHHEDLILYLAETHGYDFVSEVLKVQQIVDHVEIEYRGTQGEYGMVTLPMPLGELLEAL